jgi:Arc/MetJ family transcription regulator
MSEQPRRTIRELLADRTAVEAAIRRAVQEAVLRHAQAGQPVAGWQDGQVVWLQPADVLRAALERSR